MSHVHIWMSHVPRMNESRRSYEWVTSHIWTNYAAQKRHVTQNNDLFMTHLCVTRVIHMWDVTHSYEGRDSLLLGRDLFLCVTRVIHMWDVTQKDDIFYIFISGSTHICASRVAHINESRPTYKWVTSLIQTSHVPPTNESCPAERHVISHGLELFGSAHIWMNHVAHKNESRPNNNESRPTYEWVTSLIWMSHVPHMNESCSTYKWVTSTYQWVTSHVWMSHVLHTNESCST